MLLKQGDWYYESVLMAKQNVLSALIQYINQLEASIEKLNRAENKETCVKAIEACKLLIIKANETKQGSPAFKSAVNELLPLANIIPEAISTHSAWFNARMTQLEYNEFEYRRLDFGLLISGAILLLATTIAITVAVALLGPEALFVLPMTIGIFVNIISIGCLLDHINNRQRPSLIEEDRMLISDRAAMNIETLHDNLYPVKAEVYNGNFFAVATRVEEASAPPKELLIRYDYTTSP